MDKQYAIKVKGNGKTWTFHLADIDPQYLKEWRADGLDITEYIPTLDEMAQRAAKSGKVVRYGSKAEKKLRRESKLSMNSFMGLANILTK